MQVAPTVGKRKESGAERGSKVGFWREKRHGGAEREECILDNGLHTVIDPYSTVKYHAIKDFKMGFLWPA